MKNPNQLCGRIKITLKIYAISLRVIGQAHSYLDFVWAADPARSKLCFINFWGGESKVFGVELESDAKSLPHTIIADFHYLPKNLFGKFDFVYSNSHDQSFNPKLALGSWIKCLKVDGLLILEHSRTHGKSGTNRQDPFGVETEILPFLIMGWFSANLRLEGIYEPSKQFDNAHKYFVFSKKM